MAETLEVLPVRARFQALEPVAFPPGGAGNVFRGAFGSILRRLACVPECPGAAICPRKQECAYARLFEPSWPEGPSGFANPPRPFVLRAAHLDGRAIEPGATFHIDVHLFDNRFPASDWFRRVFEYLESTGIGPARGRARLAGFEGLGPANGPVTLGLDPDPVQVRRVTVQFLTPTELKLSGQPTETLDFAVLFARIRDRISTLRTLYGQGAIALDFAKMGARAARVRTVRADLRFEAATRRSSRTGQTHPLGGFIGDVEYEGELSEFAPWLRAACWTGVGRQTVWGKGAIAVTESQETEKS